MVARSLMKKLDFIIIGAQKAGTTTLFTLLSEHPEIYMPAGKEAPFFTQDELYEKGLNVYLSQYFGSAPLNTLWGKATPHYLNDPRAPERIARLQPDIKVIAILRDPAERALSQFRMSVRRGFEQRTFEQAIVEMIKPEELAKARELPTGPASETRTYIVRGEYGRLLAPYFKKFPRKNILIIFTSELESNPSIVLDKLYSFLEASSFRPSSMGKKFHEGGERERFTFYRHLAKLFFVRAAWKSISPSVRSRIWFWIHHHNLIKKKDALENYSPHLISQLRNHYRDDTAFLEKLIEQEVPWHSQISANTVHTP